MDTTQDNYSGGAEALESTSSSNKHMFKHNWVYRGLLKFINYREKWDKPFRTDAIKMKFPLSEEFDGTWSFSLSKLPGSPLRIKACYSKMNGPILVEFDVCMRMIHEEKNFRCGSQTSGPIKIAKEFKPQIYSNGFPLRIERNVHLMTWSYNMEWYVEDDVIQSLMIGEDRSPDVTFSFFIDGRTNVSVE